MQRSVAALSPGTSIAEAEAQMIAHVGKGFAVIDDDKLVGIFKASDAVRAEREHSKTVGESMTKDLRTAATRDSLHKAHSCMSQARISRLPVVDPTDGQRLLGMLDSGDIAQALDGHERSLEDRFGGSPGWAR